MKIEIGQEYEVCKVNASIGGPAFYEWHKIIVTNIAVIDNDTWIYFSDENNQFFNKLFLKEFIAYINDNYKLFKNLKKPVDVDLENINDRLTNLENKFNAEIKSIDNVLNKMSTFLKKYKGTNNE